jgi:hypothetical protein
MCKKSCGKSSGVGAATVVAVLGLVTVGVYVAVVVLRGVFSLHGFLYSFGLASGAGLPFAPAVRVVTLLGLLEVAVVAAMVVDHVDGRRHLELRWAWAVAHGTLVARLCRGTVWLVLATATLACDLWHHRPARLLPRRLSAAALVRVAADRLADVHYGLSALVSQAGRLRWQRYRAVVPTQPVPDAPASVIEGSAIAGPALRSWRLLPVNPVPTALEPGRMN